MDSPGMAAAIMSVSRLAYFSHLDSRFLVLKRTIEHWHIHADDVNLPDLFEHL